MSARLIQRLGAPCCSGNDAEEWDRFFSLNYMGSAEFEFCAVKTALDAIAANNNDMVCTALTIQVQPSIYSDLPDEARRNATFYIIQRKAAQENGLAQKLIKDLAGPERIRCEKYPYLKDSVFETIEEGRKSYPIGWLDLDYGFFFFLDYDAFTQTAAYFNIKHNIPASGTEPPVKTTVERTDVVGLKKKKKKKKGARPQPT